MASTLLPLLALGVAGYVLLSKKSEPADKATFGVSVPMHGGVKYLFIVRLETTDAEAADVLESKGVENLQFIPAALPPIWAKPGEGYSLRAASFMATPAGNSTVSLGMPFYGVGRLETLVRLDGLPLGSAPALEA